jgi:hypothetical protein
MPITNYLPSSRLIQPGVCTSTTRPASPYDGQAIFETDTDRMLIWNGTAWVVPNAPAQNPTGLELITTSTCSSGGTASNGVVTIGSAISSVVIGNAFSSIYDNYRIVISGANASIVDNSYGLRLSGSSGSTYGTFLKWTQFSNGTVNGTQAATGTAFFMPLTGTSANTNAVVDLWNPFLTLRTGMTGSGTNSAYWSSMGGEDTNAVSHTGFTVLAPAGGQTLTGGTIRVYGYRNS